MSDIRIFYDFSFGKIFVDNFLPGTAPFGLVINYGKRNFISFILVNFIILLHA